ncbi:MAG: pyridoxamine 5'-phosphate oxidase family protein [Acidimicrobiia bacterium]
MERVRQIGLDECWELLAGDEVGRLAVLRGGAPSITPVNYVVDDGVVVFRTDHGTKLDHGPRSAAAFEIDHIDHEARTGWSVVLTGRLEEVTPYDGARYERVSHLPIVPWGGGDKRHWMRLVPLTVSGRRVGPPPD